MKIRRTVNNSKCDQSVDCDENAYNCDTTVTVVTSVRSPSGFPSYLMSFFQEPSVWHDAAFTNSTGLIQLVSVRMLFPAVPSWICRITGGDLNLLKCFTSSHCSPESRVSDSRTEDENSCGFSPFSRGTGYLMQIVFCIRSRKHLHKLL